LKKKVYHVFLDKAVTANDLQKISDGIELEDGEIKADAIEYADPQDQTQVGIEIHSGKNRIVRRIFESLGYRVVKLDRVQFAGLTKKNVRRGDWRFLEDIIAKDETIAPVYLLNSIEPEQITHDLQILIRETGADAICGIDTGGDVLYRANTAIDPTTSSVEFKASKYDDDPDASVTITVGTVEWNANEDIKAANKYLYQDPPAGKVYIRVPVEVSYKGKGQYEKYGLQIDYSHDGNTSGSESFVDKSMFNQQDMPRDGGTAKGYFVFLVDEATANDGKGVFAVKGFSGSDEVYVAAK